MLARYTRLLIDISVMMAADITGSEYALRLSARRHPIISCFTDEDANLQSVCLTGHRQARLCFLYTDSASTNALICTIPLTKLMQANEVLTLLRQLQSWANKLHLLFMSLVLTHSTGPIEKLD